MSETITNAEHVLIFPVLSVTVNVTGLTPTLEQENDVCESTVEAMLQLSVEPLFTCVAVTVAEPVASKFTKTF